MFDRLLFHLRSAGEILTSQDLPLQVALVEAGEEFWVCTAYSEEWPAELLGKANSVLNQLLAAGTIKTTVAQMDWNTVREVARQILDLLAAVEAARSERLHPAHG
jgi:hypothetical protein